jgi:hypothetical protein
MSRPKEYEVTATFTVVFGFDGELAEEVDIEDYAKEQFLEYIGSVSDQWILDGLQIEIEGRYD